MPNFNFQNIWTINSREFSNISMEMSLQQEMMKWKVQLFG